MTTKPLSTICLSNFLPSIKTGALSTFDFRLFEEYDEASTVFAEDHYSLQRIRTAGLQEIFSCAVVTCNAPERVFSEIIEFLRKEGLKEMPYLLVVTNRTTAKNCNSITANLNKIYSRLYMMITFDEKGHLFIRRKTLLAKEIRKNVNS